MSSPCRGGDSSPYQGISPCSASRDSQGRKRLPQTHEDDASSTLSVEGATFGNGLQPGAYMAQLPLMKERISEDYIPYVHV